MATVLLIGLGEDAAKAARQALGLGGHEILESDDLEDAAWWAEATALDLIVAPVIGEPGGVQTLPIAGNTPRWVRVGPIEHGGVPVDELVERLQEELAPARIHEGTFDDQSFDGVLTMVDQVGLSGVFTAACDTVVKRIVFIDGRVAFCASNDATERVGQAFIKAGLIDEKDLIEAIEFQSLNPQPLGRVLLALEKVTAVQVQQTLREKFREGVLDLFLWSRGTWTFLQCTPVGADLAEAVQFSVGPLCEEGGRRRHIWRRAIDRFANEALRFRRGDVRGRIDNGEFPCTQLVALAERGMAIADIVLEMRGRDFAVYAGLLKLVEDGVLVVDSESQRTPTKGAGDVLRGTMPWTPNVAAGRRASRHTMDPPLDVRKSDPMGLSLLDEARKAMAANDYDNAARICRYALIIDPNHKGARKTMAALDRELLEQARSRGLSPLQRVKLTRPFEQLDPRLLSPEESFVLGRLTKSVRVKELCAMCPMSEVEIMWILARAIDAGRVEIIKRPPRE